MKNFPTYIKDKGEKPYNKFNEKSFNPNRRWEKKTKKL